LFHIIIFPSLHRHNLGLAHSNENGNTYNDQSGMMGYSYSQDNGPLMCFNAAKSWQLGWLQDRRVTYEFTQLGTVNYRLIGQSEYNSATGSDKTLIKVCQILLFNTCNSISLILISYSFPNS